MNDQAMDSSKARDLVAEISQLTAQVALLKDQVSRLDKLAHLEKQIRSGHSLADDLTHRLRG